MNQTQIRFYVGVGNDKNGDDITPARADVNNHLIGQLLATAYGGFTEYYTTGGWIEPRLHETIMEPARVFEVLTDSPDAGQTEEFRQRAHDIALRIKEIGNQENVLITFAAVTEESV